MRRLSITMPISPVDIVDYSWKCNDRLDDKEQINLSDKEVDKGLAGSKNVKVCKSRTSTTKEPEVMVLRKSKRIVKPRVKLDL